MLTVHYFKGIRGRAESIRMMLRFGGLAYKDEELTLREWPEQKKAQRFPFNGLPCLETADGVSIGQSGAANRYVAKLAGDLSTSRRILRWRLAAYWDSAQGLMCAQNTRNEPKQAFIRRMWTKLPSVTQCLRPRRI